MKLATLEVNFKVQINDMYEPLTEPDQMEPCYEREINYIGYELTPTPTKTQTAKLCGELCSKNTDCFWWSWSSADLACHEKGGLDLNSNNGRRTDPKYISGMILSAADRNKSI